MPRHLISDAHEWINEIPTIYYLAKPHVVHVLARSGGGAELPSVGLCLNASKAEARLDMATLLLGLVHSWDGSNIWYTCSPDRAVARSYHPWDYA